MEITYLGHSCFKLKNKQGVVVIDPFGADTGLPLAKQTADVVVVSHNHNDHNAVERVKGPEGREPMVLKMPGEYETLGISFFGVEAWHDDKDGAVRGQDIIWTILMDEVSICHLGDLGQSLLSEEQIARIGEVDVLLCPVGGHYTIDAKTAVKIMNQLEPRIMIPMHYKTTAHNQEMFAQVQPVEVFFNEYGIAPEPVKKLEVVKAKLPEETEIVVLES